MSGTASRSDPGTIAVVGAGQAGLQLAIALRDLGYAGRVVLVGAEPGLPYQRPPLSKGFLAGTVALEELELRDASFLKDRDIELLAGRTVAEIELSEDGGVLRLDNETAVPFTSLALATGARPRRLSVPNADAAGVCALGDLPDAHQLLDALATANDVVVVGGGFIGLEVAASARAHGKSVTVVESAARLLARVVAEPVSLHVRTAHEASGIVVLTSTNVTALTAQGRVSGVALGDGRVLPADLVVAGIGAEPAVELARALGLAVDLVESSPTPSVEPVIRASSPWATARCSLTRTTLSACWASNR